MDKRNGKNYLKRNGKTQLKIETSLEEKQDGEKSSFLFNLISFREENVIDRSCRILSFSNNNSLEVSFSKGRKTSEDSAHLFQSPFCPDSCFSYGNKENCKPISKNVKFKNKNGKKNKNITIKNIQETGSKKNSKNNAKLNKNNNSIVNNYVEKCTIDWSEIENFDLIVEKNIKEVEKIKLDLSDRESKLEKGNKVKMNESISSKMDKSLFQSWENRNISNVEVTKNDHCIQIISTQDNTKDKLSFRSDSELNFSSLREILSPTLGLGKVKPKYGLTTSTPNVTPVKFGHKTSNNYDNLIDNSLVKSPIQNFECSALESTKAKLEYLISKAQIHDDILMYKGEKLSNSIYKTQAIKGAHDKNFSVALENLNICETEPGLSNRKDVFMRYSHKISKNKAIGSMSLATDYSKVLFNSLSLRESNVNKSEEKDSNKIPSDEDISYTCRKSSLKCTRVPVPKVSTNGNFSKFVQYSRLSHQKYYVDNLSLLQKSYNIDGSFEEVKESSTCYFKSYCEFVSLMHNLSNFVDHETKTVSKFSKGSSKDDTNLSIREDVLENNPSVIILTLCNQVAPLKFLEVITPEKLQHVEKIGEGLYGEVFCCNSEEKIVYKIVPIEGVIVINGEHQKSFQEIMPEMLISLELSILLQSSSNVSPNFIQVNRISCVFGMYPEKLLQCWDKYAENRGTENDRPDCLPSDQLFIIFEFAYGGIDLESVKVLGPLLLREHKNAKGCYIIRVSVLVSRRDPKMKAHKK
ncbi:uncharacterized protein PF11_0213-like isoform X2 [Centruroides sculpturatus]|uniref:uncharacterized protein PF11_0213-like isoform X2 n=1 Tax=Centruroides sculpturatus TaxID=218467 RepID=UPI000C6D740F|nr:uncharacterized protein PF11_0213-like isoform X2 [Centruroides sculpturatus]